MALTVTSRRRRSSSSVPGAHVGQRAGRGVGLARGRARGRRRSRRRAPRAVPKRSWRGDLAAQPRGGGVDVALDDEVELARRALRAAGRARRRRPACTPSPGAKALSSRAPHGSARSTSRACRRVAHSATLPSRHVPAPARTVALAGARGRAAAWWPPVRAVAILLTSQPGDVSNPDVEFTADTGHDPAERAAQAEAPPIRWTTASRGRTSATRRRARGTCPSGRRCGPRSCRSGQVTGAQLIEFPPVLCGRSLYLLKNNGALYAISRLTGKRALEAQARLPRRVLAGVRGRQRSTPSLLARGKGITAGRVVALNARDGTHPLVAQAPVARGVLAARRRAAACTSAPRTAPSTRCGPATARCAGATRPPARSRAALALDQGKPVLRRLRRPRARDPPAATARRSGRRPARARRSA